MSTLAMLLPSTVPVSVQRDLWDWCLYAVSLAAAATAIALFLPWALERRRRPEIQIDWALSLDGDPAKVDDWPAGHAPEITPGRAICARVAILNVGDRASEAALANFVVPDCFELRNSYDLEAKPLRSGNLTAGLPPEHRVAFFAPKPEPWTPGNWFMFTYRLTYSTGSNPDQPLRMRLLFEISDSRFNRSGQRWLPSLLPPSDLGDAQAGEPWPPGSPGRLWFRWVRAAPRGRVACARGRRRDVRDLIVVPAPQASAPPAKNRRRLLDYRGIARLVNRAARALPGERRAERS
jgi:hypothetical protein